MPSSIPISVITGCGIYMICEYTKKKEFSKERKKESKKEITEYKWRRSEGMKVGRSEKYKR